MELCTGPKDLIERLELHGQATNLHTSGISQAVTAALFSAWEQNHGDSTRGFIDHCDFVRKFYEKQCQIFLRAADKHLKGLAEWNEPKAGMFVWLKLLGVEDSEAFINEKAREAKILLVPGRSFSPTDSTSSYVRATFATATEEQIDAALARLAQLLVTHRSYQTY